MQCLFKVVFVLGVILILKVYKNIMAVKTLTKEDFKELHKSFLDFCKIFIKLKTHIGGI